MGAVQVAVRSKEEFFALLNGDMMKKQKASPQRK
jgi:hypothetical protein